MDNQLKCDIPYIPSRLHQNGRNAINEFYIGELIYRRETKEAIDKPFANISLVDVSTNRQGQPTTPLCEAGDVLFNFNPQPGTPTPKFEDLEYVVLQIKELHTDHLYYKYFPQQQADGSKDILKLALEHDPIPCNFSHTVFSLYLNEKKVETFEEYNNTLALKKYKRLRQDCRLELAKMILTNSIVINSR